MSFHRNQTLQPIFLKVSFCRMSFLIIAYMGRGMGSRDLGTGGWGLGNGDWRLETGDWGVGSRQRLFLQPGCRLTYFL